MIKKSRRRKTVTLLLGMTLITNKSVTKRRERKTFEDLDRW